MKSNMKLKIKSELEKVEWPSQKTVVNGSLVIIFISAFFVFFVSVLDFSFSNLLNFIKR